MSQFYRVLKLYLVFCQVEYVRGVIDNLLSFVVLLKLCWGKGGFLQALFSPRRVLRQRPRSHHQVSCGGFS